MMIPILYKYLSYFDSSCCVCSLLLNTYNMMGNYTVYIARGNIGRGVIFENLLFHLGCGGGRHKKFKSYLFHHLSVPSFWNKAGGRQFSEVLMSIFSDEKLTTPVIMKGWHIYTCFTISTIFELEKKKTSSDLLSSSFTSRRGNSMLSTSLFLRCFCLQNYKLTI